MKTLFGLLFLLLTVLRAEPVIGTSYADFHAKFPSPTEIDGKDEVFEKDGLKIIIAFWRGRVAGITYARDTEFTAEEVEHFLKVNALNGEAWERRHDIPGRKWESPGLGAVWYEEKDKIVKAGAGALVISSRERMLWLAKSPLGMTEDEVVEKYGKPDASSVAAPAEKALSFIWDNMVVAVQIWNGKVACVMFKRPVRLPFTIEEQKRLMGIREDWQFKSDGADSVWDGKSQVAAYMREPNMMALQTAEFYEASKAARAKGARLAK